MKFCDERTCIKLAAVIIVFTTANYELCSGSVIEPHSSSFMSPTEGTVVSNNGAEKYVELGRNVEDRNGINLWCGAIFEMHLDRPFPDGCHSAGEVNS
jgi:hypothetical protein